MVYRARNALILPLVEKALRPRARSAALPRSAAGARSGPGTDALVQLAHRASAGVGAHPGAQIADSAQVPPGPLLRATSRATAYAWPASHSLAAVRLYARGVIRISVTRRDLAGSQSD